ncbi:MAG: PqqD family protein [Ignavibacteria bacterium]|nr:PqqD family protein [Ignavibacteria bacterium]
MFRKKREVFNMLELTPVRINQHEEKDGLIIILIPKFKREFFRKFIPKNKSKDIRVNLDEIGSATWLAIDGNKKVGEIVEELKNNIGEKIEPAVDRVTKFIGGLNQHNFIYFKEFKKGD